MNEEQLPAAFTTAMKELLGQEADAFLHSYTMPRTQGLRFNTLKSTPGSAPASQAITQFGLTPVPWCSTGYYYEDPARPGRHPFHTAGLYYIQEPSAMSAAELLAPLPGETVLDLAAAPGGKTTHLASLMQGQGLLVSNEIHPERAKILAENVERLGIPHALVTSAAPDELSRRFPEVFDRIMLDAPCSGEGMFRKDPAAIREWSPDHVRMCASRQWDILQDAYLMLKPGGSMVYSTCTFNRQENEETIARFTAAYPDMELITAKRLWPHLEKGEGHFVALLHKAPASASGDAVSTRNKRGGGKSKNSPRVNASVREAYQQFLDWAAKELPGYNVQGTPVLFGESLYLLPEAFNERLHTGLLEGLKVPRAGLHVAHLKKNRIEPAHSLAMALSPEQAARCFDLSADSLDIQAWLRGESLPVPAELHGWTLVCVEGLPVGWGKASSGQLKNHLPKGLRILKAHLDES
ncbi:RsmF rRNA methyltransferase first C-terminal domain-containing protein [Paenibacillus typhae]|uniref:RsmF rRNA methyltransferase first C-terminal domain-containing protein n=1 Tax=Paenibacillus typhae TaxID=1174501 RepID=UPI001C8D00B1|nr:RsmF rRNA methyltransferase first C-terminal domain-containing protein [Paenibacillus typhae]MBY0009034.1 RsmF rRNA methyltransferase first C-terminal domain-containing protein [Paenibacillus typhae]